MAEQTKTATKPAHAAPPQEAQSKGALTIQGERLAYHPVMLEKYGIEQPVWRVLVETVWPGARTIEAVLMAWSYCKARNLDPLKRPVHIVPVYNSQLRKTVETVWPGISEMRTTAVRTGDYAGCDECKFGPDIEELFIGEESDGRDAPKKEVRTEVRYPEWAQFTVYKIVHGVRCAFEGPKVYWKETYATKSFFSDLPNSMWEKRPRGQLEKCAEAAALRRGFPEELGGEYAAEEMEGKIIDEGGSIIDRQPRPTREQFHEGTPIVVAHENAQATEVADAARQEPPRGKPEAPQQTQPARVGPFTCTTCNAQFAKEPSDCPRCGGKEFMSAPQKQAPTAKPHATDNVQESDRRGGEPPVANESDAAGDSPSAAYEVASQTVGRLTEKLKTDDVPTNELDEYKKSGRRIIDEWEGLTADERDQLRGLFVGAVLEEQRRRGKKK